MKPIDIITLPAAVVRRELKLIEIKRLLNRRRRRPRPHDYSVIKRREMRNK